MTFSWITWLQQSLLNPLVTMPESAGKGREIYSFPETYKTITQKQKVQWTLRILESGWDQAGGSPGFTGCPVKLFPLGYLLFWRLLLMQIAKVGTFLKNSGNLLQDRHKNFENWFRNSWDNWGQSWQPSFRNWHFAITQRQKNNFYVKGGNFDLNYLSYF